MSKRKTPTAAEADALATIVEAYDPGEEPSDQMIVQMQEPGRRPTVPKLQAVKAWMGETE
jgi:hypothetical protein